MIMHMFLECQWTASEHAWTHRILAQLQLRITRSVIDKANVLNISTEE